MIQMLFTLAGIVGICLLIGWLLSRKPGGPAVIRYMSFVPLAIVLLLGIYIFFGGLAWFLLDSTFIFTGGGGNLTGLGLIFGPLWMGFGIVFGAAFLSVTRLQIKKQFLAEEAVRIIGRGKKIFLKAILIVVVAALGTAIFGNISRRAQNEMEQKREAALAKAQEEEDQRMDAKILQKFETQAIVPVTFAFTYVDDYEAKRKANESNLETRKAWNEKFVREKIRGPIGEVDMPSFRMTENSIYYIVTVTKTGYEKLRKNKYAIWIKLWGN